MNLKHLSDLIEEERDRNSEFRDEVRDKLSNVEKWMAIRDAIEEDREARTATRKKAAAWVVGSVLTILGIVVPVLLSR